MRCCWNPSEEKDEKKSLGPRSLLFLLLLKILKNIFLPYFLIECLLPVISILKHVDRTGPQRPVGALACLLFVPWQLDKAVVEAEIVPDGVLPALLVVQVVRESPHYEAINLE